MRLTLTILGESAPKARAKHFFDPKTKRGWAWTPKKTADCEKNISMHLMAARSEQGWDKPSDKPIALTLCFYRTIPASMSKKKRTLAMRGGLFPAKRPDLDNLIKTVKDACNRVVWLDDSQVCTLTVTKRYSDNPRTKIMIEELA